MSHEQLSFHIRIRSWDTSKKILDRITSVLKCQFVESRSEEFNGEEAWETEILGLWITLNYQTEPDTPRVYQLIGDTPENTDLDWGDQIIDISDYILGLFIRNDSSDWYKPSRDDLLKEAGL